MIDIDTREADAIVARLRAGLVDDAIGRQVADAVPELATEAVAAVRQAARRHRKRGDLERSVRATVAGSGVDTVARVTANDVAPIIVRGSRPHDIRAAAGHVLAFAGPPAGFASAVHHPGTAPDPFVARGLQAIGGGIAAAGDSAADHLAADVAARLEG